MSEARVTTVTLKSIYEVLKDADKERIAEAMELLSSFHVRCVGSKPIVSFDEKEESYPKIEISVALMKKMIFPPNMDEDDAANEFAVGLHNKWGVGSKSESCDGDTGILLFFSILDRVLFISKGSAFESTLTDSRINSIIESMIPSLKQGATTDAIEEGIYNVISALRRGPVTIWEKLGTFFSTYAEFLVISGVATFVLISMYWEKRQQREYAEVRSQLGKLDRDQALSLQGIYQCTSCPICLEDFQGVGETRDCDANESSTDPLIPTHGSDGLPLKLLRCGHVFDETCWKEYVTTGHGDVRVCPICKQDVGVSPETSVSETSQVAQDRALDLRHRSNSDSTIPNDENSNTTRYQGERNFRLMRLSRRFPRYIGQSQVQRWSSNGYRDSLVRDPNFVQRDPARVHTNASNRATSGSSRSFSTDRKSVV